MKPILSILAGGLLLAGCAGPSDPSTNPASAIVDPAKVHPVTDEMATAAQAKTNQQVPAIALPDDTGTRRTLAQIQNGRPALVYFLNYECPCCVEAHPFFEEIAKGFGKEIAFVGVMNAPVEKCRDWKKKREFTGPILSDEKLELTRAIGARAATYSAVIGKDGRIVKLYPGYQKQQLLSLVNQLASESGFAPPTMKFDEAPEKLTSGCEYEPQKS